MCFIILSTILKNDSFYSLYLSWSIIYIINLGENIFFTDGWIVEINILKGDPWKLALQKEFCLCTVPAGQEKLSFYPSRVLVWYSDQINTRQVNKRKTFNYICTGVP